MSFNPCWFGRYSTGLLCSKHGEVDLLFQSLLVWKVFYRSTSLPAAEGRGIMFQSLLVWKVFYRVSFYGDMEIEWSCFNPCWFGRYSTGKKYSRRLNRQWRFNPCWFGRYSTGGLICMIQQRLYVSILVGLEGILQDPL